MSLHNTSSESIPLHCELPQSLPRRELSAARTDLAAATSKRQAFEAFLGLLTSAITVERAKLLLTNDHDWVEVYTASNEGAEIVRTFVPAGEDAAPSKHDAEISTDLESVELPSAAETSIRCPLVCGESTIGAIALYRSSDQPFDKIETDYLLELSNELLKVVSELNDKAQVSGTCNQKYADQLEELNLVGQQLATCETEQEVFSIVASVAERVLGAARVSYVIPQFDRGTFVVLAHHGKQAISSNTEIPLQNSSMELTIIRNEPCFFNDLENSRHPELVQMASHGLKSAISVPLHTRGRINAIFNAATKTEWPNPKDALNLFSTLGRFVESSLHRIRAQKSVSTMMDRLVHDANHDELTGLPNRSCFTKTLEREISACSGAGKAFGLLFIDLDDFKKVNDTLSHIVGDQLLVLVGKRMQDEVRPNDVVARLGGDEFVILLRNVVDQKQAQMLADRLLDSIRKPYYISNKEVVIGGSVGLSLYPSQGNTVAKLMTHSDIAMYVAKREGRNNCQVFTSTMETEIQERIKLHDDLEEALRNNSLSFAYQPQLEVKTNCLVGCEALVRWNHRHRGNVSPGLFVPFAEETGLVTQITKMALDQTLESISRLREIVPAIYGSINVSAVDFSDLPTLMSRIENALDKQGLPGDALELELTERIFLEYTGEAKNAIETWKKSGIRLAIDDFGTGFSSLKYLLELQIDTLKIDQSFIRSLQSNSRQRGIVETILKMAASLGAVCVAEGVETAQELACLKDLGCQFYQGYYGGRPMNIESFTQFIKKSVPTRSDV